MSLVGVELENGGVLLRFTETAAESGGARHVQQATYPPRSPKPPYHRHPNQDERFTIPEGALRFHIEASIARSRPAKRSTYRAARSTTRAIRTTQPRSSPGRPALP